MGPSDIFPERKFHHQNVETPQWWDETFSKYGLVHRKDVQKKFAGQFVRGPGFGADSNATEERMLHTNVIREQWCTLNRVLQLQ